MSLKLFKKALPVFSLIVGMACSTAFADCELQQTVPPIPNGSTASRDDMLAAQHAIKAYEAGVQQYLDCMDRLHGSHGASAQQSKVVDELHRVADRFNEELRAFKVKSGV